MSAFDEFRERQNKVRDRLAALRAIATDVGAKSLSERIERDLVKKLSEDRFHLVVVGEFNHGKSTFINALLGRSILPVGVTPTTAAIHHIRYADVPSAWRVSDSGAREEIAFEAVRTLAVGGEEALSAVDYVEVGYPAGLLREGVLLVDTPGVNDLSLQRADITYSYIPRSDAVLFLLDAGQILKESERVFLEEKLLKASRDKIVFVITKWDLLSPQERTEAFAYAKGQLARLVKDPVVFPISAEAALSGREPESGMRELVGYLTRFLAEARGRILLDNALGEGLNVVGILRRGIDASARAIDMHADELERKIALLEKDLAGQAGTVEQRRMSLREDLRGIQVGAKKDLDKFVDDLLRELPNVIDQADGGDLKSYLPAFLENTFRIWADAETKEVAASLEALAEKTVALLSDDAHESTKRIGELLGSGEIKRLEVRVDTLKYDAGVFALFAVGVGTLFANFLLGGLLMAAAPVLAIVLKEKISGEYKKRAKEVAPAVVRQAAEKVAPVMQEMIEDFGNKLEAWVVSAGEEIHREILEVLRATQTGRSNALPDEGAERERTRSLAGRLETEELALANARTALWEAG